MGDRLLVVLLMVAGAVLLVGTVRAMFLYRVAEAGKGNASQASGSPACGKPGPFGAYCERDPHDEPYHRGGGVEWWPTGGED